MNTTTWTDEHRATLAHRCQWLVDNGHARTILEASQHLAGPAGVYLAGLADAAR